MVVLLVRLLRRLCYHLHGLISSGRKTEHLRSGYRPATEGDWCLVGNIRRNWVRNEGDVPEQGTKHFLPGAKVYCLPAAWGDGYEKIRVIGIGRKPRRYISVIMPARRIENWRAGRVYKPAVLQKWRQVSNRRWRSQDEVHETARMLKDRQVRS